MLDELVVDHLIAVAELSEIFPDLPIAAYVQTTDATVARRGRVAAELLQELDVITMLDRLVERFSFWPGEQLKLVRDRDHIPPESVMRPGADGRPRINSARLAERLEDGFTVVFDGIELRHRPSNRLAALFEAAFGCAVNINGYLSAQPVPSFGSHWDDQEVVILQLLGRKDWQVERPVALSPLKSSHGDETSGTVAWAGRVGPGDALYVPRGWGHLVSGIDELTFHYTITIPRTNG
ncbi:MAG TPA: cupin domain-containing protein, partial [Microthrixaceae bacterium]|nr:cupin domain-containing protein [Microthrixaceae bacterium]